jgi:hypothetical protein
MANKQLNTLSDDRVFASFLKNIQLNEVAMSKKGVTAETKLKFLENLSNAAMRTIGFPTVSFPIIEVLKDDNGKPDSSIYAEYDIFSGNKVTFSRSRINKPVKEINKEINLVDEFRKLGVTAYHELRHVEQQFCALQYRYQIQAKSDVRKKNRPRVIHDFFVNDKKQTEVREIGIQIELATRTTKLALERTEYARKMIEAIYDEATTQNNLREDRREVERDGYNFTREGYRILSLPRNTVLSDIWYPVPFRNVNYGKSNGYVDNDAGAYLSREPFKNLKIFKPIF